MKYSGKVGFATQIETYTDVWEDSVKEVHMTGDILNNNTYYPNSDKVNQNINLGHRISLIGNEYMIKNLSQLKYVTLNSVKWEVNSISISSPRVIVTLGGIYNGSE